MVPFPIESTPVYAHNGVMSKPKKSTDRHKPNRQVRLKQRLVEQLKILSDRDDVSITELANNAVREFLRREGLWPPAGSAD